MNMAIMQQKNIYILFAIYTNINLEHGHTRDKSTYVNVFLFFSLFTLCFHMFNFDPKSTSAKK